MPVTNMQHFPLTNAYLCQDCNCVGNCPMQCPACASGTLMGLSVVLNREAEDATQSAYEGITALAA